MCGLSRYVAGGMAFFAPFAVLFALYAVTPPGAAADSAARPGAATTVVERAGKGDRLAPVSAAPPPAAVIATVEVIGLRDAAVVYRGRDGQVLFHSDPVANSTIVARGVVLPEVTIRHSRIENATPAPAPAAGPTPPAAPTAAEPKIPEGCDPAFSPLAASARANFSARCLAASESATRYAAAMPSNLLR